MYLWLSFIVKIGFVVSMMILSGYIDNKVKGKKIINDIIQGLLFATIIRADMAVPFVAMSEIHFDVREVMLNIIGLFYGPLASGIAATFTIIFRLNSNPTGVVQASIGIGLIYLLTAIIYKITEPKGENVSFRTVLLTSILSNILSFSTIIITPENQTLKSLSIGCIILFGFPIATIASAKIIKVIRLQNELTNELKEKEERLSRRNESLRLTISELKRQEMLLNKNEKMFRTIFLNSSVASLVLEGFQISKANKESMFLLGYEDYEELNGRSILEFFSTDDNGRDDFIELINAVSSGQNVADHEFVILNKYGKKIDVEISFSEINFFKKDYIYISLHDIRVRKLREREVIKNSQLDVLTGVYNRAFLNEYIKSITQESYPVGIIMADLNGLKLVNDFLGHNSGDNLLMEAVQTLKEVIKDNGALIRMGGDEFVILFSNTDQSALDEFTYNIERAVLKNETDYANLLSISVGAVVCYSQEESILHGIERADHEMYEKKALESMEFKENFLQLLYSKRLAEDSFKRKCNDMIAYYCNEIGKEFEFDEHKMELLETAYKYYDLGGIHGENYLQESSNVEITYNLLRQIPQVSEAAIYIFYLPENWDGSAKNRLKEESIPIISRILRVVHDYCFVFNEFLNRNIEMHEAYRLSFEMLSKKAGIYYDVKVLDKLENLLSF